MVMWTRKKVSFAKTLYNTAHFVPRATPQCAEVCHTLIYHTEEEDTPFSPDSTAKDKTPPYDSSFQSSNSSNSRCFQHEAVPLKRSLLGEGSAPEVTALQAPIRLAADTAE